MIYSRQTNIWSLLITIVYVTISFCFLLEIIPKTLLTFVMVSKVMQFLSVNLSLYKYSSKYYFLAYVHTNIYIK